MEANREYINETECSFSCYRLELPSFKFIWHYHPEYELSYIERGSGQRLVGDSVEHFEETDLFFVGSNIPHTLYSEEKSEKVIVYGIQFQPDLFQEHSLSKTEFINIKRLLQSSNRGLSYNSEVVIEVGQRVKKIYESNGLTKYIQLIELLDFLGSQKNAEYLTSPQYAPSKNDYINERFDRACRNIHDNFQEDITIDQMAKITSMTPTSFCRFFKRQTGKPFTQYVNSLRVGKACKLLRDTNNSISQIAYESGFKSITHFNRTFMTFKSQTPLNFRKNYEREVTPVGAF